MNMLMGCFQPGLRGRALVVKSSHGGFVWISKSPGVSIRILMIFGPFSMDWFKGKSKPETIDFGIKYGGFL